jgi:hypothetical protein
MYSQVIPSWRCDPVVGVALAMLSVVAATEPALGLLGALVVLGALGATVGVGPVLVGVRVGPVTVKLVSPEMGCPSALTTR